METPLSALLYRSTTHHGLCNIYCAIAALDAFHIRQFLYGATDGNRTRNSQIGNLELYQLSYCRINQIYCAWRSSRKSRIRGLELRLRLELRKIDYKSIILPIKLSKHRGNHINSHSSALYLFISFLVAGKLKFLHQRLIPPSVILNIFPTSVKGFSRINCFNSSRVTGKFSK